MESETKCQDEEKTLDHNHNNEKDLISNLPDCVLAHFLSKLPTKFAVGTAILSTRWKNLFSLIFQPVLKFDDSLLLHPEKPETSASAGRRLANFGKFADRVLNVILKDQSIKTFALKCNAKYMYLDIFYWLNSALLHSPTTVDIDLRESTLESWCIYKCISRFDCVLTLALRNNFSIYVSDTFSLLNLQHLVLDRICFPGDEHVSRTLSGCPALKSLTMRYLRIEDVTNFKISISSLEYLSIQKCWRSRVLITNHVVIDTPVLEFLCYEDYLARELILSNLSSLKEASISALSFKHFDEADNIKCSKNLAALVRSCSNADRLFLSKDTVSTFQISSEELPKFCNLTSLELGGFDINGWKLLAKLLENAPKLEILSITKEFCEEKGCFDMFKTSFSGKVIAPCLLSSLVKLEIFQLKGKSRKLTNFF